MKDLYYATRTDKNGNKLTSSYTNQKSADKYGGDGAKRQIGVHRVMLAGGEAQFRKGDDEEGLVLRGMLINRTPPAVGETGRFVLWAQSGGKWAQTPFSFPQYGVANSTMKSMIGQYEAMIIVDLEADEDAENKQTEYCYDEVGSDDDTPF